MVCLSLHQIRFFELICFSLLQGKDLAEIHIRRLQELGLLSFPYFYSSNENDNWGGLFCTLYIIFNQIQLAIQII
jgi:hypothetical protein